MTSPTLSKVPCLAENFGRKRRHKFCETMDFRVVRPIGFCGYHSNCPKMTKVYWPALWYLVFMRIPKDYLADYLDSRMTSFFGHQCTAHTVTGTPVCTIHVLARLNRSYQQQTQSIDSLLLFCRLFQLNRAVVFR